MRFGTSKKSKKSRSKSLNSPDGNVPETRTSRSYTQTHPADDGDDDNEFDEYPYIEDDAFPG